MQRKQVVNVKKLQNWIKKKGGQYRVERAKLALEIGISDAHISRILKGLVPGQQTQMLLAQKTKIKKEILFPNSKK